MGSNALAVDAHLRTSLATQVEELLEAALRLRGLAINAPKHTTIKWKTTYDNENRIANGIA
jgi:hypothetical protein